MKNSILLVLLIIMIAGCQPKPAVQAIAVDKDKWGDTVVAVDSFYNLLLDFFPYDSATARSYNVIVDRTQQDNKTSTVKITHFKVDSIDITYTFTILKQADDSSYARLKVNNMTLSAYTDEDNPDETCFPDLWYLKGDTIRVDIYTFNGQQYLEFGATDEGAQSWFSEIYNAVIIKLGARPALTILDGWSTPGWVYLREDKAKHQISAITTGPLFNQDHEADSVAVYVNKLPI